MKGIKLLKESLTRLPLKVELMEGDDYIALLHKIGGGHVLYSSLKKSTFERMANEDEVQAVDRIFRVLMLKISYAAINPSSLEEGEDEGK